MKNIFYILLIGSLALASCTKDEVESPNDPEPNNGTYIDFNNLTNGQVSNYKHYLGSCNGTDDLALTGDTLMVQVVSENDSLFLLETFSNGSPNFADNPAVRHPVIDNSSYMLIPQRFSSNLFYFYGNDTIWKDPAPEVELSFQDCFITYSNGEHFIGDEIGHIDSFDSGLFLLTDKTVVSCVPGFFVDGYLIYSEGQLHASHVISDGIITPISGFSLID